MSEMLQAFDAVLNAKDYSIADTIDLAARPERLAPVPDGYRSGAVGRLLNSGYPQGIWTHQAEALDQFEAGSNVVVATGTTSGKTLVFQSAALRVLDQHRDAAILVFYPLKALVADQLVSWRRALSASGYGESAVARLDGDVLADERQKVT